MNKKIVIVGGVAGGASAAARARRLSENAEIIVLERGPYVSFANCGLPYHIGGLIEDRDDLLLQTPESLKKRFNLDVRVNHEVLSIQREKKSVTVKDLASGNEFPLAYDHLILSPGAEPFKPPIPGLDLPNVFTLKTIPDMDAIIGWLKKHQVRHVTVIGGGFIGLEAVENFRHRGLDVSLVERETQVMPPMDREMTSLLHQHLKLHGVDLHLGSQVTGISQSGGKTTITFASGNPLNTDLIVLSIGVRPEIKLAREAGLKIGERGGIVVDEHLRTSDPSILAVGDAVEVKDTVTGAQSLIPLAGPANRQGRFSADNLFAEKKPSYRGTQGTWICKVFDLTAAQTGASEKSLKRAGIEFRKVYTHPFNHAGYYPDAIQMSLKLLFDPTDGKILGAQAVGRDGVDKRIDVLATAIAGKMTVYDLCHLELAYAPPYGSAKDPVNLAGLVAENMLNGLHHPIHVDEMDEKKPGSYFLLDVRTKPEFEAGNIPGATLIPVDELRQRFKEIPTDREIILYCQVGLRGYVAQRFLEQNGVKGKNLIGGFKTWTMFHEEKLPAPPLTKHTAESGEAKPGSTAPEAGEIVELNACGLQCPGPLLKMRERMDQLHVGQVLKVTATDPGFTKDAGAWCHSSGHNLIKAGPDNGKYVAVIEKKCAISTTPASQAPAVKNKLTMVVFSNDLDRAYAAFIIANGAAAMGMEVTLFFTFWGLNILRKKEAPPVSKDALSAMFGMMMPRGPEALGLSKMHFGGMGTAMMKHVMSQKNVAPLPELIKSAVDAGVKLIGCTMSMDVMGITKEEMRDDVELGGVATFIDSANGSGINLFV